MFLIFVLQVLQYGIIRNAIMVRVQGGSGVANFIRARSEDQKLQRLEEIKAASRTLFNEYPYHEITLTTIAEQLGWSRASLYKYVATKEEVFLEIAADERDEYTNALMTAFPENCGYSCDTVAEVWAGIANAHRDWFRYGDILLSIIETNVGLAKLVTFKKTYYESLGGVVERFSKLLDIENERTENLLNTVYYHAVGLSGACANSPLIKQALDELGITPVKPDFRAEMRDFIGMCIQHYQRG